MRIHTERHDSLQFLAWLLEGWPDSLGASVGREMLERGFSGKRNRLSHHLVSRWEGHPWGPSPHDISPEILARLQELLDVDTLSVRELRSIDTVLTGRPTVNAAGDVKNN